FLDGIFVWDLGNFLEGIFFLTVENFFDGIFAMLCLLGPLRMFRGHSTFRVRLAHHTLSCSESEHGMGKKSASQVSSSWRRRLSWLLTKNDAPLPSFSRSSACQLSPKGVRSPVSVSNRAHLPSQTEWTTTR